MYVGGKEIKLNSTNIIYVDKRNISLPYSDGNVEIAKLKGTIYISAAWRGVKLLWSKYSMHIQLMPIYANKTCGLCGNFNGNPIDDINNINGLSIKDVNKFVNSWKRLELGEICPTLSPLSYSYSSAPQANNLFSGVIEDYPNQICDTLKSASFVACHNTIKISGYLDACKSQVKRCPPASIQAKNCSVCEIFKQYAQACESENIVLNWRSHSLCCKYILYFVVVENMFYLIETFIFAIIVLLY